MVRYGSKRTAPGSKWILEASCLVGDGYFLNLLASLTLETKLWSDPFQNWSSNTPSPAAPPRSITGAFTRLQPPAECLCHITYFFSPSSAFPSWIRQSFGYKSLREKSIELFVQEDESLIILQIQLPEKTSSSFRTLVFSRHLTLPWGLQERVDGATGLWGQANAGQKGTWAGEGKRARAWKGRITSAVLETTKQVLEYKA